SDLTMALEVIEGTDSDEDAIADEDSDADGMQMDVVAVISAHGSQRNELASGSEVVIDSEEVAKCPEGQPTQDDNETASHDIHSVRSRLRKRKKRAKTPDDLESEEDDGMERNIADYVESSDDEDDFEAESPLRSARKGRDPNKKSIKTVKDLPAYAQNAYVASTYGLPKLPVPMVLLPGLRSRKPPPIPVPDLTKRSRGRHVASTGDEDGGLPVENISRDTLEAFTLTRNVSSPIKITLRGSLNRTQPAHQCPYPGCLRGFSRTDNMMQHMRTHEDWPDDEAAAQILAETQKKSAKKAASKGTNKKDSGQQQQQPSIPSMIPGMPWQLPPFFWARQRGANPLMPLFPVPSTTAITAQDNKEDSDQSLEDEEDADADAEPDLEVVNDTIMVTDDPPTEDTADPDTTKQHTRQDSGSADPLSAVTGRTRRSNRPSTAKAAASTSSTTVDNTTVNATITQSATIPFDPSVDPMAQLMQGGGGSAAAAAAVWPMHHPGMGMGMQYPFMAMQPPFPPGLPFPPPAIAIPVPPGTAPPHPNQLPPNAQLIPDAKGGHTVIIPPPPPPWGLPFPGVLAMPPQAPPAEGNGTKSKVSN
ncbi:hypothetical protein FRC17_002505, partial [Serendipita sp. 399]